jgi:hypothetical protein
MHTRSSFAPTLLFLLAACGSSDPKSLTDDGYAALGKGDAQSAAEDFEKALKQMDASQPDYIRVAVGRCTALARLDGKKAKDEFLELAKKQPSRITIQDFHMVVSEFVKRRSFDDAVTVMHAGVQMFPESPQMQAIRDSVIQESETAADPEALKSLRGLGYIGGK